MIIHNTTFNVSNDIQEDFLEFLRQEHILDCLNTKLVKNPRFMKLLGDLPDEGTTYSLQFDIAHMSDFMDFETNYSPTLQASFTERYGEKCLFFSSVLEVIWQ